MMNMQKRLTSVAWHYGLGSLLLMVIAISMISFLHWLVVPAILIWAAVGLSIISAAYAAHYGKLFRKRVDGRIPIWAKVLFFPFFVGTQIYNSIARSKDEGEAIQRIIPGLYLGRRLTPLDANLLREKKIAAVLDVTAEFDALQFTSLGLELDYLNLPVLDHDMPSEKQVSQAINWIHSHRKRDQSVVVHCALGKGRSVITVLSYIAMLNRDKTVEQILKEVKQDSPRSRPNARQINWLKKLLKNERLSLESKVRLIVNPVSGGGKWAKNKDMIIGILQQFLDVSIHETEKDEDLGTVVQQALDDHVDIIVAGGGDGTLSAVACHLQDKDVKFGVIPLGTANALCQVLLGQEFYTNPIEASCRAIVAGKTQTIDTVQCNDRISLLMVGLGIEKDMIAFADRDQKNTSGVAAYLEGFMQAVLKNETFKATVTFNEESPQTFETTSLIAANAAPSTSILAQGGGNPDFSDGKIDVTWLSPSETPVSNVATLLDLWRERDELDPDSKVGHRLANKVHIEAEPPQEYVVDGELVGKTPITLTVRSNSLHVLVPDDLPEA